MKKKTVVVSAAGILLLAALYFIIQNRTNTSNSAPIPQASPGAERSLPVTGYVVKPQRFAEKINSSGTVLSDEEVELRSESAGKIVRIYIPEGAHVRKGDLLVKINDADYQAQLQKILSQLQIAKDNEERQRALLEKSLTSRELYDAALNQLNAIRADSMLVIANIAKTEIRAPFDGTIGLRYVSEGSYVTASSRIASLQNIDRLKLDFSVPERYALYVHSGQKVLFAVEGIGTPLEATVYAIEPKIDPTTRTVQIRAVAQNTENRVKPGAFANVELLLTINEEALLIPTEAVVPVLRGQQVFVVSNGKAASRDIAIGTRTEMLVHVTNGLRPYDTVLTSGLLQLSDGIPIRLTSVE